MSEKTEEYWKELFQQKEIPYPENYDTYVQQVLEKLFEKEEKEKRLTIRGKIRQFFCGKKL